MPKIQPHVYTKEEIQAIIDDINAGNLIPLPEVKGYSAKKVQNLLNRIVGLARTNYLEIGVHLGSTYVSAMYNHTQKSGMWGTAIDAWNMFGDLEKEFVRNCKDHGVYNRTRVIHADFRETDISQIYRPVNVYFYDGDHGRDCQYKAITHLAPALADQFVLLVDDFNWVEPRDETYRALRDLGYTIQAEWFLPGPYNGSVDAWWNGLFVGIIQK